MAVSRPRRLILALALAGAACADDSVGPQPRLAVAPAVRSLSIRDDSLVVSTDSAAVAISGSDARTARWVAVHSDSASWVTLVTSSGTGPGRLRWTRDATALFPGVYVDTITVTLLTADSASVRVIDSLEIRESPPQYVTRRRAWRPGEKDSMIAAIVRRREWRFPWVGDISDLAPVAIASWDSVTEVIANPAWRPPAAPAAGERLLYDSTFSALGVDVWIVFDTLPDTPGVQRDSLTWKAIFWYSPSDATWKGFVIAATINTTFSSYRTIKTTEFEASGGHSQTAAGEYRVSDTTYWEGNNGGFRLTANGGYGPIDTLETGPFTGAQYRQGLMTGAVKNLAMPKLIPNDGTRQYFSASWTNITAHEIRCYFTPVPPPSGVPQCVSSGVASIVANVRAQRAAASGRVPGTSARGRTR